MCAIAALPRNRLEHPVDGQRWGVSYTMIEPHLADVPLAAALHRSFKLAGSGARRQELHRRLARGAAGECGDLLGAMRSPPLMMRRRSTARCRLQVCLCKKREWGYRCGSRKYSDLRCRADSGGRMDAHNEADARP